MSQQTEPMEWVITKRCRMDLESYFHKRPMLEPIEETDVLVDLYPDDSDFVLEPPLRDDVVAYVNDAFPDYVFVVSMNTRANEGTVITMRPRIMKLKNPELIDAPNKKERRQIERHQTHLETMNAMIAEMKELRKEILEMRQSQLHATSY